MTISSDMRWTAHNKTRMKNKIRNVNSDEMLNISDSGEQFEHGKNVL